MTDPEEIAKKAGVPVDTCEDRSIIHKGDDATVLVGGLERPSATMAPVQCTICFEQSTAYSAISCGHPFCNSCYSQFLGHAIEDQGHECFFARCPEPKCRLVCSPQLVRSLVRSQEALKRYDKAASLARSYVDDQPSLKWCPAPDCTLAVKGKHGARGVKCACSHRFCFQCMNELLGSVAAETGEQAGWLEGCKCAHAMGEPAR